jgi:hypothetical protein
MERSETKLSLNLRAGVILGAAILLLIWAASSIPLFTGWNEPRADGFQIVPLFWASITLLPLGASALAGGISGHDKGMRRARLHLMIAAGLLGVVVLLDVFRRMMIVMGS